MAEPVRLTLSLNEDKTMLTLTVLRNDAPVAQVAFNAYELDDFISALGMNRAAMLHGHPDLENLEGRGVSTTYDPSWGIATEHRTGGSVLALQHPGFGWLGFIFPPDEAAEIARVLASQIETSCPSLAKPH